MSQNARHVQRREASPNAGGELHPALSRFQLGTISVGERQVTDVKSLLPESVTVVR